MLLGFIQVGLVELLIVVFLGLLALAVPLAVLVGYLLTQRKKAATPERQLAATPARDGRLCPYCKSDFSSAPTHVECATCATWHHPTCFEENGGCSVHGCRENKGRGVAARESVK
jgi:hypothetical protein